MPTEVFFRELSQNEIDKLKNELPEGSIELLQDAEQTSIEFPVLEFPEKVTSLNFDKTEKISGTLRGIKGQYLILDSGVLNIRKFGGYEIEIGA